MTNKFRILLDNDLNKESLNEEVKDYTFEISLPISNYVELAGSRELALDYAKRDTTGAIEQAKNLIRRKTKSRVPPSLEIKSKYKTMKKSNVIFNITIYGKNKELINKIRRDL